MQTLVMPVVHIVTEDWESAGLMQANPNTSPRSGPNADVEIMLVIPIHSSSHKAELVYWLAH